MTGTRKRTIYDKQVKEVRTPSHCTVQAVEKAGSREAWYLVQGPNLNPGMTPKASIPHCPEGSQVPFITVIISWQAASPLSFKVRWTMFLFLKENEGGDGEGLRVLGTLDPAVGLVSFTQSQQKFMDHEDSEPTRRPRSYTWGINWSSKFKPQNLTSTSKGFAV